MCCYVHCSAPLWMPYFVPRSQLLFFSPSFSLASYLIFCKWPRRQIQQMFPRPLEWNQQTLIWLFCDFSGSNRDFSHPLLKRAPWENFSLLKWWEAYKVLVPWCVFPVCVHPLQKKKNLWALSDWQLMALRQTFKDLSVSAAFLCVCVCPHISNRPCFWRWSISVSVFSWSHSSPPTKSLRRSPLPQHLLISGSLGADSYTGVGGGEQLHGSVTHDKCFSSDPFSVKNH